MITLRLPMVLAAPYRDADRLDRHAADRTGSRQLGKRRIALDSLGPLRIQPAEFTKLSLFCYIANYLVRKADEVRNNLRGF